MPDKPSSYLATVKHELADLVEDIGNSDLDQDGIVKRLWQFMEPKLKESFKNGRAAAQKGAPATREMAADKPRNAWRR